MANAERSYDAKADVQALREYVEALDTKTAQPAGAVMQELTELRDRIAALEAIIDSQFKSSVACVSAHINAVISKGVRIEELPANNTQHNRVAELEQVNSELREQLDNTMRYHAEATQAHARKYADMERELAYAKRSHAIAQGLHAVALATIADLKRKLRAEISSHAPTRLLSKTTTTALQGDCSEWLRANRPGLPAPGPCINCGEGPCLFSHMTKG